MRRSAALIVVPLLAAAITPVAVAPATEATAEESYVVTTPRPGSFPLVARGRAAPIVVSEADFPGVVRALADIGFADWAQLETDAPSKSIEADLRRNLAFIRARMKETV